MASKSEENRTWVTLRLVDTTVWYLKIQSSQVSRIERETWDLKRMQSYALTLEVLFLTHLKKKIAA